MDNNYNNLFQELQDVFIGSCVICGRGFRSCLRLEKTATISHSTSIVIQTCTQLAVSRQNTITVQRTGYSTLNAGECTPFLVPCIVAGLVCNSLIYLFLYVSQV